MRVCLQQRPGKGTRLGFRTEILKTLDAAFLAVPIDRPELGFVRIAGLAPCLAIVRIFAKWAC
jgi:hypothetical protein